MQRRFHDRLSLESLSEHHIYTITDELHFDYQWWKAKNCYCSVDAHFHEGAWCLPLTFSPIKVANTLIIYRNDHIAFELPDLQDKKSLTLCWHSISEWGRDRETRSFAYKARQSCISEYSQPIAMPITNDARPKIIDAPLTLILPWAYPQYIINQFGLIYH